MPVNREFHKFFVELPEYAVRNKFSRLLCCRVVKVFTILFAEFFGRGTQGKQELHSTFGHLANLAGRTWGNVGVAQKFVNAPAAYETLMVLYRRVHIHLDTQAFFVGVDGKGKHLEFTQAVHRFRVTQRAKHIVRPPITHTLGIVANAVHGSSVAGFKEFIGKCVAVEDNRVYGFFNFLLRLVLML